MRGSVLNFDVQSASGIVRGDDGARYSFKGASVESNIERIRAGTVVDFEIEASEAVSIFPVVSASGQQGPKSKVAAGLLALFLGGLGIHKFYLGYNRAGVIHLLCIFPGLFLFSIPTFIIFIISLIEGIIYLTKTDEDFHQTYEVGKRSWF